MDDLVKVPETPAVKDTTAKAPPPVVVIGKIVDVGTGSGDLSIDGKSLPLKCNDKIRIAKGSYKSITIKNIQAEDGCAITVTNNGLVDINGNFSQMNLSNLKGVIISGNGDPGIQYGFQFHDNSYRSIIISKPYTSSTIQYVSFKNIQDYVISYDPKTVYDGSEGSYSKNLKFLNIRCENTSSFLQFPGSVENGPIIGLIKGLEIANLTFVNSSKVGTVVWIGNVEDYDVHNNRVDNINTENNNHNGIFHFMGNGKFHDNYVSNHQGNALRAWTYSIGTPKEVLIYNNIVVNSRKYSAFETQSFENYMRGSVTYANAKVYNNTCGNLNLNKDWYGNVVDVYNLEGGTCQVFNNIGFNFPAPNPVTLISNQQSVTKPTESNNLYFTSIDEVGFSDKTTFKLNSSSTAKNKGQAILSLLKDYYGVARNVNKPSIGAVE
ncbi:hypothetical protein DBR11_23150 [Pedobacter sp. HMWF019]|nr:hypothetical protein DBR11_23150 [Pedobacter sp. HMWF019]